MNSEALVLVAFLVLAAVLPVMALRRDRLNFSQGWRIAAIWAAMFVLAAMGFTWLGI